MAAGKGTRLKSARPKVLHEIGGQALLRHVITAAKSLAAPEDIYVIVGHQADSVEAAVQDTGVRFVLQAEQRGTGHAIQTLRDHWNRDGRGSDYSSLMVLSGDVPLIRPETLRRLQEFHDQHAAAMTILTAIPTEATGYGRVLRVTEDSADVKAIVEQKALTPEQQTLREINSGIYCFETAPAFAHLDELRTANAHAELYLTDMAALLVAAGEKVVAVAADSAEEVLGANTIREMMELDCAMRLEKARALMAAGVTIFMPETVVIDSAVEVEADAVIEPYVQLRGATRIGARSIVRSFSVITDSTLGDDVEIRQSCVLTQSDVANHASIGPMAHLRPGSRIGAHAHIGNFVETKNTQLGDGAKAGHLTYLGDAIIGENTNIGAGTITCNYDGERKHPTTIGANAFIGSQSALVAPVTVGEGAYVAAGSTITENVPAESLALGRARQVNKDGWAKQRKKPRTDSSRRPE